MIASALLEIPLLVDDAAFPPPHTDTAVASVNVLFFLWREQES